MENEENKTEETQVESSTEAIPESEEAPAVSEDSESDAS